MSICFVLITTAPGLQRKVYNKLLKIPEIIEGYIVSGECDIITKLKVNDPESLLDIVANKIRTINGVKDTRTLTGLELN